VQRENATRLVRAYARTSRWQQRLLTHLSALFNGLWLGVMDRESLDLIDEIYYEGKSNYVDEAYNSSGLRDWEAAMIEAHFPKEGRVVVTGAGGGREVLALVERGYDAVGYEPNGQLVSAGGRFLEKRGHENRLRGVDRDAFPPDAEPCDAVVVGWGSYMLIPGRARRVDFLRDARERLPDGGPILLSFFARPPEARSFLTIARAANVARRLRGRTPVEVGDALSPNYTHHFTRDEIASELEASGFRLVVYEAQPYGHAVGIAA
jgi:hypothetical protein